MTTILYYREGSSDKIYQVAIEQVNGGFVVNFAFGRRGTTLQTGTKTSSPVPYEKAKAIFDKLIASKLAKGYTPGAEGTPYALTDREAHDTGLRPQLLNPITQEQIAEILANKDYWLQEKFDGKRILLRKEADVIVGINRKGLTVGLPEPVLTAGESYAENYLLDGECISDTLHVFDLLALDGDSLAALPYSERLHRLQEFLTIPNSNLVLVETAMTTTGKTRKFGELKISRKEGVVFKRHDASYTAGRPASGGSWLKHKFTATGSFIVSRINAVRSVGLEVCDGNRRVAVGNVTVPINRPIPIVGAVVEVCYLYAYERGSLFQPVFIDVRDDISAEECMVQQLKFRAENTDEES